MTFSLFIRDADTHDAFVKYDRFPTYKLAGLAGQSSAGPGNFYIESGNYVPSRAEQLLEDVEPKKQKQAQRIQLTVQLARED